MKSTLVFAILFILSTIIGTITHEMGHYLAGKYIGLDCSIHFASCRCSSASEKEAYKYGKELYRKYQFKDSIPKEMWEKYQSINNSVSRENRLWVTIGGPLQTVLTGTLGFLIFFIRRKYFNSPFDKSDWILIFFSLFWLREPFNLLLSILTKLLGGSESFFGGDELRISRELNLWDGSIPITFGIIGIVISSIVVFKYVPEMKRIPFILGGFIGGISGYVLWMKVLGPVFLP